MINRPYQIDLSWREEPKLSPFRWPGPGTIRTPLYVLQADLTYTVTVNGHQVDIIARAGFVSDGASIPAGLRWVIPQNQSTWAPALFHDLCYSAQGWHRYTRAQCDALFGVGLTKQGIPASRILAMYGGVTLFGGRSWSTLNAVDKHNRYGDLS